MDIAAVINSHLKDLLPGLLGMEFIEAAPDRVVARLVVRPNLCTTGGILHGGAIMAFADTLGAAATMVNLGEGGGTTTLESKTNFMRPAPVGSIVLGETTPLHRGKRTMVWQTRVTTEKGKLLAVVTQTQMVMGKD